MSTTTPAITIDTSATTGDSTYTPGDVTSGGGSPACATDTTDNFCLYLAKVSAGTPPAQIDESLIDNTQGDSGGQFRLANGFYMYNLPLSQLSDLTAQYQVGISPNSDGSNPAGVVQRPQVAQANLRRASEVPAARFVPAAIALAIPVGALFRATPRQDQAGRQLVRKPDPDNGRQSLREPARQAPERYG